MRAIIMLFATLLLATPLLAGTAAAEQEPCYRPTDVNVYWCPRGWGNPYAASVCGWAPSEFADCLV